MIAANIRRGMLGVVAFPLSLPGTHSGAVELHIPVSRTHAVVVDSGSVHKQLRRKINDFQDAWRKVWENAQYEENGALRFDFVRYGDPLTTEARRFWSIQCYLFTPKQVPYDITITRIARYPVVAYPDRGAVCPSWAPPLEGIHPDEGEWIDLALPQALRKPMFLKRDSLIRAIEKAHAENADDNWIAGQRVRFVLDQHIPERALAAAQACHGDTAWCASLLGLVLANSGMVGTADSAFRIADSLGAMALPDKDGECVPPETRMLFTKFQRKTVTGLSCVAQRSFVDTMWWLADPLWSSAGNERYVEHHARVVLATLRAVTDRDERYVWATSGGGDALREMVVRYGWPSYTYWPGSRFDVSFGRFIDRNIRIRRSVFYPFTAKEYSADRTALLPDIEAILDPFTLTEAQWSLHHPVEKMGNKFAPDDWWPQEHMLLPMRIEQIGAWQDVMWRDDSTVVYQVAADDPLKVLDREVNGASLAVLVAGASAATTHTIANTGIAEGLTLRMSARLRSEPTVISAEILPRTAREPAYRRRYGLRPPPSLRDMKPGDAALSVPLFMRMPNREMALPTERASVLRYMAGDLSFPRAEPLALYWESYGFSPSDSVDIIMVVRRNDDVNLARKLFALIGVASLLRDSITVKYSESDGRHGTLLPSTVKPSVGRAIALDVSAQPAGRYVVSVEMRTKANVVARSEQQFTIREK